MNDPRLDHLAKLAEFSSKQEPEAYKKPVPLIFDQMLHTTAPLVMPNASDPSSHTGLLAARKECHKKSLPASKSASLLPPPSPMTLPRPTTPLSADIKRSIRMRPSSSDMQHSSISRSLFQQSQLHSATSHRVRTSTQFSPLKSQSRPPLPSDRNSSRPGSRNNTGRSGKSVNFTDVNSMNGNLESGRSGFLPNSSPSPTFINSSRNQPKCNPSFLQRGGTTTERVIESSPMNNSLTSPIIRGLQTVTPASQFGFTPMNDITQAEINTNRSMKSVQQSDKESLKKLDKTHVPITFKKPINEMAEKRNLAVEDVPVISPFTIDVQALPYKVEQLKKDRRFKVLVRFLQRPPTKELTPFLRRLHNALRVCMVPKDHGRQVQQLSSVFEWFRENKKNYRTSKKKTAF
eukprot:TRINITY_DN9170_c0_g1_i4.p1 TRINITY_DN9170_c0_g1~~TRINITY_DN9170_c0_g1_i4.p1  ORF type:complete len:404 (+),score=100.00 TRINITY_DN9170_c0_g1_i4:539-1750(+)